MAAYYNEIDPYAAQWLRNLMDAGEIAPGEVDERSIEDVSPDDLSGFEQCHFFAGVGVWNYALRRFGWPDNKRVWTGSCPCQPFSSAGKRTGTSDERHLWPAWFHLVQECRPEILFGEQVASKDGLGWLDLVSSDLEGTDYSFGAADLCAAGCGAPHIRQRLFFGAYHTGFSLEGLDHPASSRYESSRCREQAEPERGRRLLGLGREGVRSADPERPRLERRGCAKRGHDRENGSAHSRGAYGGLGERNPRPTNGFWRDADWLFGTDGKWRPVEPGAFPLAYGADNRVGRLRAYGNAIVAPVAETFIRSFVEAAELDRQLGLGFEGLV